MLSFNRNKKNSQSQLVKKLQQFEKLIEQMLEPEDDGQKTLEKVDWKHQTLSFDDPNSLENIELPKDRYDRQILVFAIFSHFFESGLLLSISDSGPLRILHGFMHGETFDIDVQPIWQLKLPQWDIGDVLRLKSIERLPTDLIDELQISSRQNVFMFKTGQHEAILLTTQLAEPWLEDHIEKAHRYLKTWLKTQ